MTERRPSSPLPLLALLAIGACCGGEGGGTQEGLALGDQAPDFELQDVFGLGSRSLSDQRGQVVLVNFWGSNCLPCRLEMPELEALWTRYQDQGLVILGISVDGNVQDARIFLDDVPVSFPVLWDEDGSVSDRYQVRAIPRTVLVDRRGRVRARFDGFDTSTLETISREIQGLLEEQP